VALSLWQKHAKHLGATELQRAALFSPAMALARKAGVEALCCYKSMRMPAPVGARRASQPGDKRRPKNWPQLTAFAVETRKAAKKRKLCTAVIARKPV